MLKSTLSIFVIVLLLFCANPNESQAIPVDLSSWSTPKGNVTFSADGFTAYFKEDPDYTPITLETTLDIPAGADNVNFSFDWELIVATDNQDYFDFYLGDIILPFDSFDAYVPIFYDGGYFSNTMPTTISGNYSVDLSSYIGTEVDIVFSLMAGWDDGWSLVENDWIWAWAVSAQ